MNATPTATPNDIRDILGPIAIPSISYFEAIALLLILLLIALAAYYFWRKYSKPRIEVQKSPKEKALEALELVKTIMTPENSRAFSYSLSDVLRSYIQEEFKIEATQDTTEEFLNYLSSASNSPLKAHYVLLRTFMNLCDAAKYAKTSYEIADLENLLGSARHFIIESSTASEACKPEGAP